MLVPQVPKRLLQPVPQWSTYFTVSQTLPPVRGHNCLTDVPHHPYCEQQFPKVEPEQIWFLPWGPQLPSVETVPVGVDVGPVVARVDEGGVVPGVESRYQLATGSFMHSPMVTPLKPRAWRVSIMVTVRLRAVSSWMS